MRLTWEWSSCAPVIVGFGLDEKAWIEETRRTLAWVEDLTNAQTVQLRLPHIDKHGSTLRAIFYQVP